ncbi:MAG: hypothetical protein EAZ36_04260 [Verrucomicrobia bacterium]|nr:MAG: hypothetical protein EAZ36_04260 [Verrucomicrobiota bacterium]
MKPILRSFLGGVFAVFFAVVAHAANVAPGAFSATTVKGDVTYKLAGTLNYLPLSAGVALPQGATVKTGSGSLAIITFANGATASIRPNSEIEVAKFHVEVGMPVSSAVTDTQLNVVDGSVVSKLARLNSGSSYVVNTPVGAAGVRGTTFSVTYNAATGSISVATAEGVVVFTRSADGVEFSIPGDQMFDGVSVRPITAAQLKEIESAINVDISGGGTSPGAKGPTIPDVDTTISVSVS